MAPAFRAPVALRFARSLRSYDRILRNRTYFPLWLGQLVSNIGDTLNYVAIVVLVFRLSGSGLAVSTVVVFEILPVLLVAPFAGLVIDRFPRKAILVGSDIARALDAGADRGDRDSAGLPPPSAALTFQRTGRCRLPSAAWRYPHIAEEEPLRRVRTSATHL